MKKFFILIVATLLVAVQTLGPATQVSASGNSYVALGDSVAAGMGLPTTVGASSEDILCQRSPRAYPYEFARSTGMTLSHVACSGAKADEGVYDVQQIDETTIPQQLDAAFANGTPDVISITVGANDVRWTQFIRQCLSSIDCDNRANTNLSDALLADLRAELNWIMFRINYHSGGNSPTVLLNGYYAPYSNSECGDALRLTANENRWINERVDTLNNAISTIAGRYTFAQYVETDFSGRGLCSDDPWVQGLQDTAPFHPTVSGQQAIADANLAAYEQAYSKQPDAKPYSLREKLMGIFSRIGS